MTDTVCAYSSAQSTCKTNFYKRFKYITNTVFGPLSCIFIVLIILTIYNIVLFRRRKETYEKIEW